MIKISQNLEMNSKEFNTIMKLNKSPNDFFPKIYGGGEFIIKLPKKTQKKTEIGSK